jgi:hypothetical protein
MKIFAIIELCNQIGKDFKLSTYPEGGNTAQEALDLVAKTAYDALIEKNRKRAPQLPATTNSSEALQRLLKVLNYLLVLSSIIYNAIL